MSSVVLEARLAALSAVCVGAGDLRGRAKLIAVALDIAQPSATFLSDLYDACVASVARAATAARDGGGGDEAGGIAQESPANTATQLCATCTAAALHYLPRQGARVAQQFVDAFFLPLLACDSALSDRACRLQACSGVLAWLAADRCWQQLRQLLDSALASLAVAAAAGAPGAAGSGGGPSSGGELPYAIACTLLAVAVRELQQPVAPEAGAAASADDGASKARGELLRHLLAGLRAALPPLLVSPAAPVRQAALKVLVPAAVSCSRANGGAGLAPLAQELWQLALGMLGGSGDPDSSRAAASPHGPSGVAAPQRTALALLVSIAPLLLDPASGVDVCGCARFWELLRACLLMVLEVSGNKITKVDDAVGHLSMLKVDQLHAPAPEFTTEAVVPKSYIPRKKELKQRKPAAATAATASDAGANSAAADAAAPAAALAAAGAGAGAVSGVPLEWQCVLWSRALQHGNVQVQRLAMRTLLQRDWRGGEALRAVPPGFVAGVLLPALAREYHYRGGAAESEVLDVQVAAAAWLHAWFAAAPLPDRAAGLLAVRGVALGNDMSRLGLQQLMRCLAAAAAGAAADGLLVPAAAAAAAAAAVAAAARAAARPSGPAGSSPSHPAAAEGMADFFSAMLTGLRAVLLSLSNFGGYLFKRSVCHSVLAAAAAVMPVAAAGVGPGLRLLLELPPAALEPGGDLRELARCWLLGRPVNSADTTGAAPPPQGNAPLTATEGALLASIVQRLLDDYWSDGGETPRTLLEAGSGGGGGGGGGGACPDASVLSRLLLLFDDTAAASAPVVARLQQALYGMYGRPYLQAAEVERALGLLRELLTVVPPLPTPAATADAKQAPLSALQSLLLGLVSTCCEDLCSAASHASDAFLDPTARPAASDAAAAAGLARAEAAWACVALALARFSRAAADPAVAPHVRRLAGALLALLSRLCSTPLPANRPSAVVAGMRAGAAAADALRLASACSPLVRAMALERLDGNALAAAALRDAAAVAAAAAGGACLEAGQDATQALLEVEAAKWPLLDAATACAAESGAAAAAVRHPAAAAAAGSSGAAAAAGALTSQVVLAVLPRAVEALSEYPEGQVLPLLRCLRRCWAAVARGGEEAQAAAARAVGAEASGSGGHAALEALCWAVVRALWNALCATQRRPGPVCAAFVNTALLPGLYVQQRVTKNHVAMKCYGLGLGLDTFRMVALDANFRRLEERAVASTYARSASGRHDVLLVASLIDKLPNLAGLARTCEVLGAGRLVLADLAATRDPLFTAVSVTAERWLPMEEVKPAALLAWLERKAAEGYTLVGLEQTAESVRLPEYRWPARVVLVLGREKEGLPPEVLSLLDVALEIPQSGIIRSLNVHVTGAIALYEYVRQRQAAAV
ncbi:putative methyltransferase TARBP1 [Tetrabaena socialis]|uniref:Putative methyltransferase TARBP1 n=1 Tax=Tetrabaena socialis TaxID=47790 RepID=A0A2J8A3X4_9CHLO|nr:putative methyltransferase TARBP1 [Tetrabaena socialis]|eukprot:PNH07214.1 putative methyltransferase TARBP1 [Tetrabaena socialis]